MVERPVHGRDGYFGDTLKVLAMLVISGNWWAPSAGREVAMA